MNFDLNNIPAATSLLLQRLSSERYMNRFTLVGGTALAIQLGHRQSEDLDFIFDGDKIDTIGIRRFIARTFPDYRLIREEKGYQLDFLVNQVKLTFFSSGSVVIPFRVKAYSFKYKQINIAGTNIIACLKMATISQRNTMRDYYDLYYISKHIIPLAEIFKMTKELVPNLSPITYSETIIFTKDIPDAEISAHLCPAEKVTKEQIAEFFTDALRKLKESIKQASH